MKIEWIEEEVSDAVNRTKGLPYSLAGVTVAAIMTRAVELYLARTSGQVKEDLNLLEAHDVYTCGHVRCAGGGCRITASARRLAALAQEAETLRATVAEVEALKAGTEVAWREEMRRLREARADVERLRVDNASMDQRWMRAIGDRDALAVRLQVAESRLAAIREELGKHDLEEGLIAHRVTERIQKALDGDSPQETATPNHPEIPNGPPSHSMPSNGSGDAPPTIVELEAILAVPEGTYRAEVQPNGEIRAVTRYPCAPTCTHDDAATPGHPERVKERSEVVTADLNRAAERSGDWWTGYSEGHDVGSNKMRAACWEAVQEKLRCAHGMTDRDILWRDLKAAIEEATP